MAKQLIAEMRIGRFMRHIEKNFSLTRYEEFNNIITLGNNSAKNLVQIDSEEFATMTQNEFSEAVLDGLSAHTKRARVAKEIMDELDEYELEED